MRGLLHHFYSSRSLVGLAMLTGLVLTLWPISTCKATDVPLLVAVAPISPLPAPEKPRLSPSEEAMHGRPLPDGGVARLMGGDIVEAWLSMPTHRYKHGVLGDRIEAGAITIRKSDGSLSSFVLTRESVFEDLTPRLADLDRDGRTEVIVVRSYLKHGGTVSVLGLRMDELDLLAELPPIGQPNRWLNPSIIADLDGSGRPVIGLVRTPHIGGQLQIWRFAKGRLEPVLSATGFSNHSIGNRALGLTAVLSSGEERRIIIPDATQANLLVLDAISLSRLASIPLPARPIRDFVVQRDSAGHQWVEIGFEDGITYKLSDPSGRLFD